MKQNLQNIRPHLLLLTLSIFAFSPSCKKFVEISPPPNEILTSQVFSNDQTATTAVLGIYLKMMSGSGSGFSFGNGGITLYAGLSADELNTNTGNSNEMQFNNNSLLSTNSIISNALWTNPYQLIYYANSCIEGLQASSLDSGTKNQLLGEAMFSRAFLYFNMVNLYGPVSLETSTSYQVNAIEPRTPVDSIYDQIISDLNYAQSLMTAAYPTSGRVRPNQYTALALLAKVYLYLGQWSNAEGAATQIISQSGVYQLATLDTVFLSTNNTPSNMEAIWQLSPVTAGDETTEGQHFVPSSNNVIPNYSINSFLLSAFEPGDFRFVEWLDSNVVGGVTYYYPYKYKLGNDGNSQPLENYMVFRLGEQYLIRAEARAEQNELTTAAADLNTIRNRAGLANTLAATQSQILSAIQHERQVELFCEWGNRWFDLKRTGEATTVLGAPYNEKSSFEGSDTLYPIPLSQLTTNPFLKQNPNY